MAGLGEKEFYIIDLSHVLREGMPSWPTDPAYQHRVVESSDRGDMFTHYEIALDEHGGTHVDAPRHRYAEGAGIDELPLQQFVGHAVVIEATQLGMCGVLTGAHIAAWEAEHVEIQAGDIVLLHFGWDELWDDREAFLKDWPGLSADGAAYLAEKQVKGVGTDALSIDVYDTVDYPAHGILLEQGVAIFENVAHLKEMPAEFTFMALPLRISSGSGAPVRAVGLIHREHNDMGGVAE